jgi:carbohydrate-selective porin OprB
MRCPFCGNEDTQVKDSRPAEDGAYLPDEYGVEFLYSWQLTPTLSIRPDLQLLWAAGDTGTPSPATVIQLQATWVW